jgi:hypothetical protein
MIEVCSINKILITAVVGFGVHSELVKINEELLERKVAASV